MTIKPTRSSDLKQKSAEIERQIQEFLEKGGEIKQERIRTTRQVDLTFRHYAQTAMEGKGDES